MENSNRKRGVDRVDKYGIASKYGMDALARFALVRGTTEKWFCINSIQIKDVTFKNFNMKG